MWVTGEPGGEESNIVALIYKLTPVYAYYATCARRRNDPDGDHFVTTDNRTKKSKLYKSIFEGSINVSYAGGTKRRRAVSPE